MQKDAQKTSRVVEIIIYQLAPDTGSDFHQIMKNVSVPLHQKAGLEILTYGNSLHGQDVYFLIRLFESFDQMTFSLNNFYESDEWKNGPRSEILDCIKTSSKSVMLLDEAAINILKSSRSYS